ncbi:MAG: hypothetical protein ACLP01_10420 [Solirubrobacteraceae bacterium]
MPPASWDEFEHEQVREQGVVGDCGPPIDGGGFVERLVVGLAGGDERGGLELPAKVKRVSVSGDALRVAGEQLLEVSAEPCLARLARVAGKPDGGLRVASAQRELDVAA